jgi:pimeloyl-ACP methyl ester carboxylesterase
MTLTLPPSQYLDIDGKPVRWVEWPGPEGAPTAVCVHGLAGSLVNWMALAPLLADRYRVVAFDLAGHGLTPPAGRTADIRSNRRLVDAFLHSDVVGGLPVLLIGNSMGGLLSALQAARHPETVDRLVLLDPAVPLPFDKLPRNPLFLLQFSLIIAPFIGERVLARQGRMSAEAVVRQSQKLVCADPSRVDPDLFRASVALIEERAGQPELDKALLQASRSLTGVLARPGRYRAALEQIQAPTLLVFGAKDKLVPIAAGELAHRRRPDWTYVVHPDLGHVPMIEDPAWTAQQILEWAPVPALNA